MPISGKGWELLVSRMYSQDRGEQRRTIGKYAVYRDGVVQPELAGYTVEARGPGDNSTADNGRCVEPGRYALATQNGENYVTIGYVKSNDSGNTPKPGIELCGTNARTEILVHPGHHFIASIGCINLTASLADGNTDIEFVDSRDRVIKVIADLKDYLGPKFPTKNGIKLKGAYVVIDDIAA